MFTCICVNIHLYKHVLIYLPSYINTNEKRPTIEWSSVKCRGGEDYMSKYTWVVRFFLKFLLNEIINNYKQLNNRVGFTWGKELTIYIQCCSMYVETLNP